MRQNMRKLKLYCQIVAMVGFSLNLQACSTGSKMAMDYLPDTAKVLIEKDIRNGYQDDEDGTKSVSVKSMLASILEFGDEEDQAQSIFAKPGKPIASASITPGEAKPENLVTPAVNAAPLPSKKPVRMTAAREVLEIINLPLDEQILSNIKQQTQDHVGNNSIAEISVGPVAEAENMQLASLQAMVKASSIGKELKNDFAHVSIKFDPLLPRNTLKIIIKGKKHNA